MKFFERFSGQKDEFKAMHDRQRMLGALKVMHLAHVAHADMQPKPSPEDEIIASDPVIVDIRSRHPEYQPPRALTSEDIDPLAYLNREVVMPSYVKIIPVEQPGSESEIG